MSVIEISFSQGEILLTGNTISEQQFITHIGPLILSNVSPAAFLISNLGSRIDHCSSTVPTTVPGGDEISIF